METLKYLRDKAASVWLWSFQWVANHPKTTVVILAALAAANFARKY